jgi:predicted DNA-binding transcriptional regulator AlpA
MLPTTIDAVRALLKADPTLTPAARTRVLAVLRAYGKTEPTSDVRTEPRLLRRAEVARRLGCSLRAVDSWTRDGILEKVTLPGRVRAAGFRESDLSALIEGKGTTGSP